jgi:hypothetical protein
VTTGAYELGPDPYDADQESLRLDADGFRDAIHTALAGAYTSGFRAGRRAEYVEIQQGRGLAWEAARDPWAPIPNPDDADVTHCRCGMTLPGAAGGEHVACIERLAAKHDPGAAS